MTEGGSAAWAGGASGDHGAIVAARVARDLVQRTTERISWTADKNVPKPKSE